jgi:hypothetical protein
MFMMFIGIIESLYKSGYILLTTKNSNMMVLHVVAYVTAKTTLLGYNDSFAFFTQMKIKLSYYYFGHFKPAAELC